MSVQVDHMPVLAADVQRSTAFYRAVLGALSEPLEIRSPASGAAFGGTRNPMAKRLG